MQHTTFPTATNTAAMLEVVWQAIFLFSAIPNMDGGMEFQPLTLYELLPPLKAVYSASVNVYGKGQTLGLTE